MLRRSYFLMIILSSISVIVLFRVKYEVDALQVMQKRLEKEIHDTREGIGVLNVEWTHLASPKRLQEACSRHLPSLTHIQPSQLIALHDMIQSGGKSVSDTKLDTYMDTVLDKELDNNEPPKGASAP